MFWLWCFYHLSSSEVIENSIFIHYWSVKRKENKDKSKLKSWLRGFSISTLQAQALRAAAQPVLPRFGGAEQPLLPGACTAAPGPKSPCKASGESVGSIRCAFENYTRPTFSNGNTPLLLDSTRIRGEEDLRARRLPALNALLTFSQRQHHCLAKPGGKTTLTVLCRDTGSCSTRAKNISKRNLKILCGNTRVWGSCRAGKKKSLSRETSWGMRPRFSYHTLAYPLVNWMNTLHTNLDFYSHISFET